jgi:hypothetical protein
MDRRQFKQQTPFEERLASPACRLREEDKLPPGSDRDELGVSNVSEYRAYTFGNDRHIANIRSFICDNDGDATVWAKQLVDDNDVELWCGGRLVARLNATSKPGSITHDVRDGRMIPKPAK